MKEKTSKLMKLVIALMLCLCVLPAAAFAVGEAGDNGSFEKAQVLEPGEFVSGNLSSSGDMDYYAVTLDRPGYVTLTFNHEYLTNPAPRWYIDLYNSDYDQIFTYSMKGREQENETEPMGLPAGTCYVRVRSAEYSSVPYALRVNHTPADDWERELNNDFQTANPLATDTFVNGTLYKSSDMDYYVVSLDRPGYVSLTLSHEYEKNNMTHWSMELYNSDYDVVSQYSVKAREKEGESQPVGLPAGTYYVRVKSSEFSSVPYALKLNYTPADDWEQEFNNEFQTADPVAPGAFINGTLNRESDWDFYEVQLDRPGYVSLTFNHDYEKVSTKYWIMELYNGDYEYMAQCSTRAAQREYESYPIGLPAGTYYVRVKSSEFSSVPYALKLNYTPADDWEQEFNDEFKTAEALPLNLVKHGSIMNSSDEDFYVFRLDRPEVVDVSFFHDYVEEPGTYWTLRLYDDMQQELWYRYANGRDNVDAEGGLSLEPGTYYLRVQPEKFVNIKYDLVVATRSGVQFKDVKPSDYFYNPVQWAVKKNITKGIGGGNFGSEFTCTRGQAVTFLWHAAGDPEPRGSNQFKDVKSSDYFCKAAVWAAEKGITKGIGGGNFGSEYECTRGQIVTFLWKALGDPEATQHTDFSDVKTSDYFYNPVQWAVQNHITSGIGGGMFGPEYPCTRGQIVTFLHHAYAI